VNKNISTAERFFIAVIAYPRLIIAIGIILILAMAAFMPTIVKDTSADAFISNDNPAMVYREHVKNIFGLEDPFVVAVVNRSEKGIFNPDSLELVKWLTDQIMSLEYIDPERVTSLATENNIRGTPDGMLVEPFLENTLTSLNTAKDIQKSIERFPLFQGSLVAKDNSTTVIVAESTNEQMNSDTYRALLKIVDLAPKGKNDVIYVAGEGAAGGYLGDYIDSDMQRLNPLAGLVISLMLFVAFRTIRGMLLPNVIVFATVAGAIGIMAASGISFYIITNGLIAILIGIAVADSIHIFSRYYELYRDNKNLSQNQLVVTAMVDMWRPVTVTTFTTIAGFTGIYLASDMPPMRYFGIFASVGIFIAWVYSIVFLPSVLSLLKQKHSPAFRDETKIGGITSNFMKKFGRIVLSKSRWVIVFATTIILVGIYGVSFVVVDDQRIDNFQSDELIYYADKIINKHMDGVYYFDIVVETKEREGLLNAEMLKRISTLQEYAETLPHVNGSSSVVDYIKKMNQAVNNGEESSYIIPDNSSLIAQLFLLYSSSASPEDFEEKIDYEYRHALIRLYVDTGSYQSNRILVPILEKYIEKKFNTTNIKATLTGRLKLDYHWIDNIAKSHISGLILSLTMVCLMTAILFRSIAAGIYALLPVGTAILLVYAVMGFGNIPMGVGTSMFAAIGIGLGVDFAIHTIDKLKNLMAGMRVEKDIADRMLDFFPGTGRALFFNFLSIALGFLVLTVSEVPSLINFGALVAVAVSSAFFASITLIPAMANIFRPKFLTITNTSEGVLFKTNQTQSIIITFVLVASTITMAAFPQKTYANEVLSADVIINEVNNREEGVSLVRDMRIELTDRRGTKLVRETKVLRKYFNDSKRIVIYYKSPSNIRGTSFLTYDYDDINRDDDQWLYLPSMRKVKRISASDRGDYFLGTDFTYDDIKNENKIVPEDYTFKMLGKRLIDGVEVELIEGVPINKETAKELGYGKLHWYIDRNVRYSRKIEVWDINENHLKTVTISKFSLIEGIWTATRISAKNHKTGHTSVFVFNNVEYDSSIPDRKFSKESLRRGIY
jgi:predicted RND superfamily exporter protein